MEPVSHHISHQLIWAAIITVSLDGSFLCYHAQIESCDPTQSHIKKNSIYFLESIAVYDEYICHICFSFRYISVMHRMKFWMHGRKSHRYKSFLATSLCKILLFAQMMHWRHIASCSIVVSIVFFLQRYILFGTI